MKTCMASPVFGGHIEDIKPLIQSGASDSAALMRFGKFWSVPDVRPQVLKSLLIPNPLVKTPDAERT